MIFQIGMSPSPSTPISSLRGQAPSPAGSSFTGSSWIKPSELTLEPTAESLLQPTLASTAEPALEMLAGRAAGA